MVADGVGQSRRSPNDTETPLEVHSILVAY